MFVYNKDPNLPLSTEALALKVLERIYCSLHHLPYLTARPCSFEEYSRIKSSLMFICASLLNGD